MARGTETNKWLIVYAENYTQRTERFEGRDDEIINKLLKDDQSATAYQLEGKRVTYDMLEEEVVVRHD